MFVFIYCLLAFRNIANRASATSIFRSVGSILISLSFTKMETPSETSISWGRAVGNCRPHAHRSTTTMKVCHRLNTFIFAMENLIYTETSIIMQKTNFFHTGGKAAIMYLTHMRAYKAGLIFGFRQKNSREKTQRKNSKLKKKNSIFRHFLKHS